MVYHASVTSPVAANSAAQAWLQLLSAAVVHRASDIHLEPSTNGLTARLRIDGVLVNATALGISPIPLALKDSLRSYIKVSAAMDIAQQRLPQDAHWASATTTQQVQDCRIASMPTATGEKLVIRLLASNHACADLATLGYDSQQLQLLQRCLGAPYGLILMTGPTGCGKTTSIYSALQTLDLSHINVCTIEDPVELLLAGVNQVQVNEAVGLSFASALRAILRQDPDVIVVGEIRDQHSATMAVQAAQTGHLVISTLHANDATQAITRLIHMGIAPVDLAASVQLITAQRLVRRLCASCKQAVATSAAQREVYVARGQQAPNQIYQAPKATPDLAHGCKSCIGGYLGRMGLFQMLPITAELGQACMAAQSAKALQTAAAQAGVKDLAHHALLRIAQGDTSWEEASKHVALHHSDAAIGAD